MFIQTLKGEIDKISRGYRWLIASVALLALIVLVLSSPNMLGFILQLFGSTIGILVVGFMLHKEVSAMLHWASRLINKEKHDGDEGHEGGSIDPTDATGLGDGSTEAQAENPQDR